ncbi:MAG: 3-hydroxyacyl-CoA dehydrogenase family protein [Planctomycetota bacterium]
MSLTGETLSTFDPARPTPAVMIVGVGVVGQAIAADHLRVGIPVWLVDRDSAALQAACDRLVHHHNGVWINACPWGARIDLPVTAILPNNHPAVRDETVPILSEPEPVWLVIESIAEQLEIKQAFFRDAATWFGRQPFLTTNTSTLSIEKIASAMKTPSRLTGLHFFMPVVGRDAAEVIPHAETDADVITACHHHLGRLGKTPLDVGDGPGFVVNRMLAPYLNLSLWFVCGGVSRERLREAALAYGMPMSPLELIELISPQTAFDGGRVVWQAFPERLNPSPLLPAMVKLMRRGNAYPDGNQWNELVLRYRHHELQHDDAASLASMMATTMRIESSRIIDSGIADAVTINAAMAGGLGWRDPDRSNRKWSEVCDQITQTRWAQRYPDRPELASNR